MDIRVTRARKIVADGRHNAFTGITRFQGKPYITFRSATNHVSGDGIVRVLAADDADAWQPVGECRRPEWDLRDPKIVAFGDSLLVYCAAVQRTAQPPTRVPMVCRSRDGVAFDDPVALTGIPEGYWLWHAVAHDGRLYGTAYSSRGKGDAHVMLYQSSDGLHWEHLADFPVAGNETYLDFDAQGRLWALVRCDPGGHVPSLCCAEPPYTQFQSVRRLPMRLQGPMVKRFDNGCVIICRQWDPPFRSNTRTALLWLEDKDDPKLIRDLPSGGDTSYAGWLDVGPGRAIVSYYSAHEHKMAEPHESAAALARDPAHAEHSSPADIFVADISYQ